MNIQVTDKMQIVTPADGMILSNGEMTSECLYMPIGADTSMWQEINIDGGTIDEDEALLEYANEITNANDTTLGDAVKTLADGYQA